MGLIELEWKKEQLEQSVMEVCEVVPLNERPEITVSMSVAVVQVDSSERMSPVWSGVNNGKGESELNAPRNLVTDRGNGEVFVYMTSKIQVYDTDGNYQWSIGLEGLINVVGIAITPHQLFVMCIGLTNSSLVKLDKLTDSITSSVTLKYLIRCITADTDTLYVGVHDTNRILHLSLDNMSTIRMTSLNSPHQDTRFRDLKVTTSLFVVLFDSSNKPTQTFSRDGNLHRIIASEEEQKLPYCLCLDRHSNIIVSDNLAHNIKVFSPVRDLIVTIRQEGTGPGEFKCPMGIDVDKDGRIVVVDRKDNHVLQFF